MKLPHSERAYVPSVKLIGYLLSETHPTGKDKAALFRAIGFTVEYADALEQILLGIARSSEVARSIETDRGTKYVVEAAIHSPNERFPRLRTVWFLPHGHDRPHLGTAFPLRGIRR